MKSHVLQDRLWPDFIPHSLLLSYGCFDIVVAVSFLLFLGASTAVLTAFRIHLGKQPSEASEYLVRICKLLVHVLAEVQHA